MSKTFDEWRDEALDLRAQLRLLNSMIRRSGYEVGALGADLLKPALGEKPKHIPPYPIERPEVASYHYANPTILEHDAALILDAGLGPCLISIGCGVEAMRVEVSSTDAARQIAYRLLAWADRKDAQREGP